ncbi:cell division protein FtsA [Candidatus Sumerlaeota bacterium]|nr:cell division protein FtsA [Candidatus Sumerlaeota bacterium]
MSPSSAHSAPIVAALDIGTTKICAIIGSRDDDGSIRVLGIGAHPSKGLARGMVVDFDEAVESIEKAVSHAEQMAGCVVEDVYVGIAGGHMASFNAAAEIQIDNAMRGVDEKDIEAVVELARRSIDLPKNHEIIQCFREEYFCDGVPIANPEDRKCHTLRVRCHIVTAAVTSAQNIAHCVQLAGLRVADLLVESVASAYSALNENEKELGVLLIDIGGGTSDLAVYQEGKIRHSSCIPYGGDDITNDIRKALKISRFDAENLKKKSGCSYARMVQDDEEVEVNEIFKEKRCKVQRRFLAQVIQARCQEILQRCLDDVRASETPFTEISGVVLTGGSSLLGRLPELTERMCGLTVKIGQPQNIKGMSSIVSSPIYSTGIGLLAYGLKNPPNRELTGLQLVDKIKLFFRRLINWYD